MVHRFHPHLNQREHLEGRNTTYLPDFVVIFNSEWDIQFNSIYFHYLAMHWQKNGGGPNKKWNSVHLTGIRAPFTRHVAWHCINEGKKCTHYIKYKLHYKNTWNILLYKTKERKIEHHRNICTLKGNTHTIFRRRALLNRYKKNSYCSLTGGFNKYFMLYHVV